VGLVPGTLSLVSTIKELLGRKSSVSGLEKSRIQPYGFVMLTMRHFSIRERLALTWRTSGGFSKPWKLLICFFKKSPYDSVRREVLYNILIGFGNL
jgi:hypothetical protein